MRSHTPQLCETVHARDYGRCHHEGMDFESVPQWASEGPVGVGREDLPTVHGELFLAGVRAARACHDPSSDFEGFVEALWEDLARSFAWAE